MKRLIPADTVDAAGNVWETTGENIRNGAKEFSENDVKLLVSAIFPVGSVYCGENSFILSVGKWEQLAAHIGSPIAIGGTTITGETIYRNFFGEQQMLMTAMRMWKRVA